MPRLRSFVANGATKDDKNLFYYEKLPCALEARLGGVGCGFESGSNLPHSIRPQAEACATGFVTQ